VAPYLRTTKVGIYTRPWLRLGKEKEKVRRRKREGKGQWTGEGEGEGLEEGGKLVHEAD